MTRNTAALYRMDQRQNNIPAAGPVSRFLDEAYPDSVLRLRYHNMKLYAEIGWYDSKQGETCPCGGLIPPQKRIAFSLSR